MKRIIIVCEGQTEQSFCNDVLQPFFNTKNIYLETPTTKKKQGGIVGWKALKHQIETHLLQDKGAFITTLIDYYGLYEHHQYPNWLNAEREVNKSIRMDKLENGMYQNIQHDLQRRFIPYIQLHEFEAVLFSDITAFNNGFEEHEFLQYDFLLKTIADFENPEMINNGVETAPSKRLNQIIKGYSKVTYGSLLAQDIGLEKIRNKCPRFNKWIEKLETI